MLSKALLGFTVPDKQPSMTAHYNTLYKFCGKVNRRKFGVPMGGFMSPALAILCCGMIEFGMEHLGGLVGFAVRYMDGEFGIYAVSDDAEEKQVSEYFRKVVVSYPPH